MDTLRWLKRETDVWFEITNLIIPQANDNTGEFQRMCDWILENVGDEVPVHFTAFHPDFRMRDRGPTPPETLIAAREIALATGLKYVYTGNVNDATCGRARIARTVKKLSSNATGTNSANTTWTVRTAGFAVPASRGISMRSPAIGAGSGQPVDMRQFASDPPGDADRNVLLKKPTAKNAETKPKRRCRHDDFHFAFAAVDRRAIRAGRPGGGADSQSRQPGALPAILVRPICSARNTSTWPSIRCRAFSSPPNAAGICGRAAGIWER